MSVRSPAADPFEGFGQVRPYNPFVTVHMLQIEVSPHVIGSGDMFLILLSFPQKRSPKRRVWESEYSWIFQFK
jgi:hypothetical protein